MDTKTRIIAMINMKGGVAKTTTTIGLAEALVIHKKKKVLVIDLDPQTNATSILISPEEWQQVNDEGQTIYHLFKEATDKTYPKRFDINKAIRKGVGNIKGMNKLDLLCSSVDMIYEQDDIIQAYPIDRRQGTITYLEKIINSIKEQYDYILIDCPPSLNLITQNGLAIADSYIIPTIPDELSTRGIPQLVRKVEEFSVQNNQPIKSLGIVVTKVRTIPNGLTERVLERLENTQSRIRTVSYPNENQRIRDITVDLFETRFKELKAIGEAGQYLPYTQTYEEKWGVNTGGNSAIYTLFNKLADEVILK